MKKLILLSLMAVFPMLVCAQNRTISGKLTDRDTKEGVIMATVQMLKADSTFVKGTLTNGSGEFSIAAPDNGKYLLRFTSVGYTSIVKPVVISENKDKDMGNIVFSADAIMLKGATVVGQAAKVTVQEDTFVYNASAYRTPEGSVVEELVKKLPGAQVDDDGKITINGKEVKKILVDGKEFMTGDTKTAMKNLPTSIIDKIKTYEEKSDLAKVTGIDDGEEETVLDFGIKKGMNKGYMANADAAIGTHGRYAERLMGGYFKDNMKLMLFGNANNTNDAGFPGGGGGRFGGGRQGLNASKMLGVNMNYTQGKKFNMNGNVRWNHGNSDVRTAQSVENFVSSAGSFSNSLNQRYTRDNSWNSSFRLEWKPDTMTNILFRPTMSYSTSDGITMGTSASYNEDPYMYVDDPLSEEAIGELADRDLMVNTRKNRAISYGNNKSLGAMLQYNRKLGSKGRNLTLRADVKYKDADNKDLSTTDVHLYQIMDKYGNDSTYQTNRYNYTPTTSTSYAVQATYSEPIFKAMFLQFSYKFTYKYNKSDRSTYDFSNMGEDFFNGISPEYRGWDGYFSRLDNPLEDYLDTKLSRFSEYTNYIHEMQMMLRVIRQKYRMNVGVMVQPQKTHFVQDYQGVQTDMTKNVVNVTPTFDFRYRFSKVHNLRINYRGSTSQPSMSDLLDITDDSDPLNIKKGNPGLKPSFTNMLRINYNNYIQKHQRAIMAALNYSNTRNSISNMVTYDEKTGGRTTRPENINGNWNMSGMLMFNTAIDSAGYWNVNTFTSVGYNNYVGYLSIDKNADSQKNTTRTTTMSERLSGSYRNSWLEVELDGTLNYTHTRNLLQSQSNLDTWQFSYGGSVTVYMPWGMSIATNMHENSRRGYNDNSMNTNELIWNAQISQPFLKGNALNVSLQFYDILHNQSNFSRTINAMQRSDTQYNSINSYAMLHVVYRLNLFGGKASRNEKRRPEVERGGMMPPSDRGLGGGRPQRGGMF
ncbi:TonB-dependent receptor [Xylanibacter caecicola]|uniref:TonB-dependent receptor n=1 Tax=Xylanibacter caecicola TaxID=2736294 RepID=UPI00258DF434|nr:TonB-dependent receptor [Xylanibacter caecicola]